MNTAFPDLESIFRTHDASALIHNGVSSQDLPLEAWQHCSQDLSPFGTTSFPEILQVLRGDVLSCPRPGQIVEHQLTSRSWTPWAYNGEGPGIQCRRRVSRNRFAFAAELEESRSPAYLLLLVAPGLWGRGIEFERLPNGLCFQWKDYRIRLFQAEVETAGAWVLAGEGGLLRQWAGGQEVVLPDEVAQRAWAHSGRMGVGIPFRGSVEVHFTVEHRETTPVPVLSLKQMEMDERKRWERFFAEQVPDCPAERKEDIDSWFFAWHCLWANHCEGGTGVLPHPFTSAARLHYGSQWWWDQAFHSVVLGHLRQPSLAWEEFENFFEHQLPSGQIFGSLRFHLDSTEELREAAKTNIVNNVQPPVLGMTFSRIQLLAGPCPDPARWGEALARYLDWLQGPERDTDGDGLTEIFNGFDSSGDQSPRWDSQLLPTAGTVGPMRPTATVEDNIWMAMLMARTAELLVQAGEVERAADLQSRSERVFDRVEECMWEEQDGFYYDLDVESRTPIRVKTPYAFMALFSPRCPDERARALVQDHLLNPEEFWGCSFPLPSVSLDHPAFDPVDMWRGPTWVNLNWMVIQALLHRGFSHEADLLRRKTLDLVGPRYANGSRVRSPRIWEWYHPHTGEALGNHQYSWSALIIDLMMGTETFQLYPTVF